MPINKKERQGLSEVDSLVSLDGIAREILRERSIDSKEGFEESDFSINYATTNGEFMFIYTLRGKDSREV